jgi:hypothetical protein
MEYENDNICPFLKKKIENEFVIINFYDDNINLIRTLEELLKSVD